LKDLAFDACLLCLRRLGETRPVVVVLDDLHWADAQTLAFMRRLLDANRDTPLLTLIMTRPTVSSSTTGSKETSRTSGSS
jgi:predicted ATPase